jgi:ATP-dependent DNA helicase RecG
MHLRHREHFLVKYLRPLLEEGALTMTEPNSPRSPHQRYVALAKKTSAQAGAGR